MSAFFTPPGLYLFFFFNDTATTEIYTLSLHDALPISDPSYAGQVVVMTYPLIGNYGCRDDTAESSRVQCRALVVRELSADIGHARGERTVEEELQRNGIPGLREVDTRALTRHLRDHGTLRGVIA